MNRAFNTQTIKAYTKMKRYLLIIGMMVVTANLLLAQNEITPVSPTAASFAKYGTTPVSLYTGIPNISIPIYTIKIRNFELPVSLNYHAGGVKVEDVPSWVGMGWTLNAGGVLNRKQNGITDEDMIDRYSGFTSDAAFLTSPTITQACFNAWTTGKTFIPTLDQANLNVFDAAIEHLSAAKYDLESDFLSFSCGNESGKFILNAENQVFGIPQNSYIITNGYPSSSYNASNKKFFNQWVVKNSSGVEFVFGKSRINGNDEFEITYPFGNSYDCSINTWYINEIKLPTGEQIRFDYDYYSYDLDFVESPTFNSEGAEMIRNSKVSYSKMLRLKEINFPTGKLVFVAGTKRKDLVNDKVLDRIESYAKNGSSFELVKIWKFVTNNPTEVTSTTDDESFRYALKSIETKSPSGTKSEVYKFEYENESVESNFGLPSRKSMLQDLWGYYNGNSNNGGNMTPAEFQADDNYMIGRMLTTKTGSRVINTICSKYGTLKKITYPTGGYTLFEYENNTARIPNNSVSLGYMNAKLILESITSNTQAYNAGVSVLNTNGNDIGYSQPFTIHCTNVLDNLCNVAVTSHVMPGTNGATCGYSNPAGTGNIWDSCIQMDLEKQGTDGNFSTAQGLSSVHFDRSYSLGCNSTYRLKFKWNSASNLIGAYGYFNVSWTGAPTLPTQITQISSNDEILVGGLRVKKITDYDPITAKTNIRKFNYNFSVNDDDRNPVSSGIIGNLPLVIYKTNSSNIISFIWLGSFRNSPLYLNGGGDFGYKKVSVDYGEDTSGGRTVSYFTTFDDYPDVNLDASHYYPFPKVQSLDWKRGLLLKELYYSANDLNGQALETKTNLYDFYDGTSNVIKVIPNIQISHYPWTDVVNGNVISGDYGFFYPHLIQSLPYYLKKETTEKKTNNGNVLNETIFTQNLKCLLTSSVNSTNSNNKQQITYYKYPQDYSSNNSFSPLISKNIVGVPVDTRTYVDNRLTSGMQTKYNDLGQPVEVFKFESTENDIAFNNLNPYTFTKKQTTTYNADNNPDKVDAIDNIKTNYVWAYNKTYPVAKIESSVNTTINITVDDAQLKKTTVYADIQADVAYLKGLLNSYLTNKDYQVTLFTYKPLVGMTSQTDPAGRTTYYEYDDFGRLKLTKDLAGNILKKYEYHYAGQ